MSDKNEKITVTVGSVESDNSGREYDSTRQVVFEGHELAAVDLPGYHHDRISDTRGTKQTLYKTSDGRLLVHINEWTRWQGEPTTYQVHLVTEDELKTDYWQLAAAAGLAGPMSIDEYLNR